MTVDPLEPTLAARARVGTTLAGKYRLERLLGTGGMAAVYAATHRNGSKVAIKMLHTWLSRDAAIRPRFLREGYLANAVEHSGVVHVLDDVTDDDGSAFLVMELLNGETVAQTAARSGGKLEPMHVAVLAELLLDVLAAAHKKGIVHRDIKPDNLFVTRTGELKVLDFGIARIHTDSPSGTKSGLLMGTPGFMPPEQVLGHRDKIDGQSDVWAVGATMHRLMTGGPIHDARSPEELWFLTATLPVAPVCEAAPEVPASLGRIVDVALSMDKDERWASARLMQQALRQVLASEAVDASAFLVRDVGVEAAALEPVSVTGPTFRQTMFDERRKRWGVLGAAIAIGGASALGVALRHGRPKPPASPVQERSAPAFMSASLVNVEPPAAAASASVSLAVAPSAAQAPSAEIVSPPSPPAPSVRKPARPKAAPAASKAAIPPPSAPAATARDLFDEP